MTGSIPASQLVVVNPSVLGAGGDALDVIGLLISTSTRVPIGVGLGFPTGAAVSSYFGATSDEAIFANGGTGKGSGYFGGFNGSSKKPGSLLIAQYNKDDVAAYLRGADVSDYTLTQLKALSGALSVTMDGYARVGGTISLTAATSFSSAAAIIQSALSVPTEASVTGSIAGTTLTVTAIGSGTLAVGQTVTGSGVTAGTIITALGTGAGGTGTYTVNHTQAIGSEALTATATPVTVTYDSISGAFVITSGATGTASTAAYATGALATLLKFTQATGAVLSQGAAATTPTAFMDALTAVTQNFVTFTTLFDPDGGSGNTLKQEFAAWKDSQNDRYCYVCWDTDATPTLSVPATGSLGYILEHNGDSGTCLLDGMAAAGWDSTTGPAYAAFVMGAAASVDYTETRGRISFAYKMQEGLSANVTDVTIAANLSGNPQSTDRGNGYNIYGDWGAPNNAYIWFQRGFVTGDFEWLDSYINQVWLNSALQIALLELLKNARSVPYDVAGSGMIEATLADPINAGLNFGAFGPGTISAAQEAEVNASAGASISQTLQTQGYYLQVLQASATTRAARTSPPCKFWYLDRGAVQAISLASVALQ